MREAAATTVNPLARGTWVTPIEVEGVASPERGAHFLANYRLITPRLLSAMGMTLRDGRDFDPRDRTGSPAVALVSRSLARRFWGERSPLGRRIRPAGGESGWSSIVGVVGDVADAGEVPDALYLPYAQHDRTAGAEETHLMVRALSGMPPGTLASPVRNAIWRADASLATYGVQSMEGIRDEVLSRERFGAALVTILALLGTLIALLGAYGVTSYRMQRRRPEIGVRLALGALPSQVLRGALSEGLRPVLVGIAAGTLLALLEGTLLRRLVPDLGPFPVSASLAIAAGLLGAATTGLLLPAWKAARTDPASTLRME